MRLLRLLFIALAILLLAGCIAPPPATLTVEFYTPTPPPATLTVEFYTPTPPPATLTVWFYTPTQEFFTPEPTATDAPIDPTPIAGTNILRNPYFTFVPGQVDFAICQAPTKDCVTWQEYFARTLPVGRGQIDLPGWRDLSFPDAQNFMAQPNHPGSLQRPWLDFLVTEFGNTAQEINMENDTGVTELHQSHIPVRQNVAYKWEIDFTPFVLGRVPELWRAGNEDQYIEALIQGGGTGATVPDWIGAEDTTDWASMQIMRVLIIDSVENRPPYMASEWFDGNSIAAQTGKPTYEMLGGEFIHYEGWWFSDDTHCLEETCEVTLIVQIATREVDGIVPHLSGTYFHHASLVPYQ